MRVCLLKNIHKRPDQSNLFKSKYCSIKPRRKCCRGKRVANLRRKKEYLYLCIISLRSDMKHRLPNGLDQACRTGSPPSFVQCGPQ